VPGEFFQKHVLTVSCGVHRTSVSALLIGRIDLIASHQQGESHACYRDDLFHIPIPEFDVVVNHSVQYSGRAVE
jgi:hypothetical protein